jgi:ParB-like chromosome segregation protein Spo0J
MTQQTQNFDWTQAALDAAQLLADGKLSQSAIAEQVGVSRSTIVRWSSNPDFASRVDSIVDDYRKVVRRRGLAVLERRVEAQNDRWIRLQRVIEERADDPEMESVPGGRTGLITKDYKTLGGGESSTIVPIYSVDTGLLRELREHEKQAAQELGQWTEKRSIELPPKAYDVSNSPELL